MSTSFRAFFNWVEQSSGIFEYYLYCILIYFYLDGFICYFKAYFFDWRLILLVLGQRRYKTHIVSSFVV